MLKLSSCYALSISAAALLAGCGGSQPPIGAPGAMPQSRAIAYHAERGGSWMLLAATSEDLLYVSNSQGVLVYTFPEGKVAGELTGFQAPAGLCSDGAGDVFVTDPGANDIVEYAHGGTTPITTVSDQDALGGCSVDPTTGNLAATGAWHGASPSTIAVYPWSGSGFGTAVTYTDSRAVEFLWCSYDNSGDLFANGTTTNEIDKGRAVLDELPEGGTSLVKIAVKHRIRGNGSVQWDGTYLDIANPNLPESQYITIYQLQIASSKAKIANTITLEDEHHAPNMRQGVEFWLRGGNVISPENKSNVGIWSYPAGGKPITLIDTPYDDVGVTISVASR
jgi:hypothetical protein